jgi:two-component system cell cycle response regulator
VLTKATTVKILLADDETIQRTLLAHWLAQWGYEVVAVCDGQAALDALEANPDIRLALCDWVMPKLDGPELCKRLRSQAREPYVYVVLLTGRDSKRDVIAGLEAGADDYIVKPCNPLELEVRLRAGRRVVELQSELVAAREKLRFEAMHDSLTGLFNRRATMDQLDRELSRAWRVGSPVAAVMIDVDHFKSVNDAHGHAGGDAVLREVAARLRQTLRAYDTLGRIGGEEFVVLLPECDADGAAAVAERLRMLVSEKPIATSNGPLRITASFGISSTSQQGPRGTAEELLRTADQALYAAKRGGRNRVVVATLDDWQAVRRGSPTLAPPELNAPEALAS